MIRLAEAIQHAYSRALAYHAASQLHLLKGDRAKAHPLIERQIEALRTANIADDLPYALAYSSRALVHVGDTSGALSRLPEGERLLALALAEPRGMRALVAHCHLGLGKLCRRNGQYEQTHEHLTIATTMYREMDMGSWLARAEAEMRALT